MGGGTWKRQLDFKAVYVPATYGTAEWHLYKVVEDPGESRDFAVEGPELLGDLKDGWNLFVEDVGFVPAEG
jgi:arylsulfatase